MTRPRSNPRRPASTVRWAGIFEALPPHQQFAPQKLSSGKARLLGVGRAGTADHVERIVRGWRCVDRRAEAREAAQRHRSRGLRVYQDADGMVVVRGRLEPEVGALLMQALAAARETLYQRARGRDGNVAVGHGNVSAEPLMWRLPLPLVLKRRTIARGGSRGRSRYWCQRARRGT